MKRKFNYAAHKVAAMASKGRLARDWVFCPPIIISPDLYCSFKSPSIYVSFEFVGFEAFLFCLFLSRPAGLFCLKEICIHVDR